MSSVFYCITEINCKWIYLQELKNLFLLSNKRFQNIFDEDIVV